MFLACSSASLDSGVIGVTTHDNGTVQVVAQDCADADAVYVDGVPLAHDGSCETPFTGEGFVSMDASVLEFGEQVHELGPVFVPVSVDVLGVWDQTVELELVDAPEHEVYGFEPIHVVDHDSIEQDGNLVRFTLTEDYDGQPLTMTTLRQDANSGLQLTSFHDTPVRF